MGVSVERRLQIRVAQQRPRGLDRLADFGEQRCLRVPERMPRYSGLINPIACGS